MQCTQNTKITTVRKIATYGNMFSHIIVKGIKSNKGIIFYIVQTTLK